MIGRGHKLKTYSIYHLDHVYFELLSNNDIRSEKSDNRSDYYRRLFDSHIQVTKEHRAIFGSITEEEYVNEKSLAAKRRADKCFAAQMLFELGAYTKVAEVKAPEAHTAFLKTQSVNGMFWYKNRSHSVTAIMESRSSTQYDLIEIKGERYLKMPIGFLSLRSNTYTNVI